MTQTSTTDPHNRNFTDLLEALLTETSGDTVTLRDLLNVVQRRSFGAVILVLGVIAISPLTILPGTTWAVAAVTLLFAAQMLFGSKQPWMPRKLLDAKFSRELLVKTVEGGRHAAYIADQLTSPRLTFLTRPPFIIFTSLACIGAALVTFPLALLPLLPIIPGVSLVIFGIGLTARDGLILCVGLTALAGAVYAAWNVIRWPTF
ncbi:MAG: exopolysaccharide biosynthesis protein [Hyphomonadaceae bacterium]